MFVLTCFSFSKEQLREECRCHHGRGCRQLLHATLTRRWNLIRGGFLDSWSLDRYWVKVFCNVAIPTAIPTPRRCGFLFCTQQPGGRLWRPPCELSDKDSVLPVLFWIPVAPSFNFSFCLACQVCVWHDNLVTNSSYCGSEEHPWVPVRKKIRKNLSYSATADLQV